jgi:tetrahydromethanopterin S-methyltransferase subunit E
MVNNVCLERDMKDMVPHSSDGFGYGLIGMLFIRLTEGFNWMSWSDVFKDIQGAVIAAVAGFFTVMLLKYLEKKVRCYARAIKSKIREYKEKSKD